MHTIDKIRKHSTIISRNYVKERDNLDSWQNLRCYSLILSESVCVFSDHQVVEHGLQKVLVLEDDVRFEPRFKRRIQAIMDDTEKTQLDWDLM